MVRDIVSPALLLFPFENRGKILFVELKSLLSVGPGGKPGSLRGSFRFFFPRLFPTSRNLSSTPSLGSLRLLSHLFLVWPRSLF